MPLGRNDGYGLGADTRRCGDARETRRRPAICKDGPLWT